MNGGNREPTAVMSSLLKRVQKLEARWTCKTGLVPHSPEWFDYWGQKFDRSVAGEDVDLKGFTIDVTDAFVAAFDAEQADIRKEAQPGQTSDW